MSSTLLLQTNERRERKSIHQLSEIEKDRERKTEKERERERERERKKEREREREREGGRERERANDATRTRRCRNGLVILAACGFPPLPAKAVALISL